MTADRTGMEVLLVLEKHEIYEIMDFMKVIYQGRKIDTSDNVIATWQIMFDDCTKQQLQQAIKKLAKKSKYVPSVHEILDEIEDTFTVEKCIMKNGIVINVRFKSELIPFKFRNREQAIDLIEQLRLYPSVEDIRLLHEKNQREMNPFTTSTYVNQDNREEFDKRMRNTYYMKKMKG